MAVGVGPPERTGAPAWSDDDRDLRSCDLPNRPGSGETETIGARRRGKTNDLVRRGALDTETTEFAAGNDAGFHDVDLQERVGDGERRDYRSLIRVILLGRDGDGDGDRRDVGHEQVEGTMQTPTMPLVPLAAAGVAVDAVADRRVRG